MFINREISWLEFNQRVLNQAQRSELPLLERIKFLSISASNLDEFFQVRVGGLMLLRQTGKFKPDITGLSPSEQLECIRERAGAMKITPVCDWVYYVIFLFKYTASVVFHLIHKNTVVNLLLRFSIKQHLGCM